MPIDIVQDTRYYVSCDNCREESDLVFGNLPALKELLLILKWRIIGDVVACPKCAKYIPKEITGVTLVECSLCQDIFENPFDLVGENLKAHAEERGWMFNGTPEAMVCPKCFTRQCGIK